MVCLVSSGKAFHARTEDGKKDAVMLYSRVKKLVLEPNQLSRLVEKPTMWFLNRSYTNRPVQLQKQARSLKFRIYMYVEEELYYPCSEIKGADQLRGYREANLRLCFRLCRLLVFPWGGSILVFTRKLFMHDIQTDLRGKCVTRH